MEIMDFLLGINLVAIILFFWVLRRLSKTRKQYQTLLRGMENKNLEEVILRNKDMIEKLNVMIRSQEHKIKMLEISQKHSLKNVALERYDAFPGVGGRQSFSIALLDDQGSGVVLSTIHSREDSNTYAKYIHNCKSEYALSEEEKRVIEKSLN